MGESTDISYTSNFIISYNFIAYGNTLYFRKKAKREQDKLRHERNN